MFKPITAALGGSLATILLLGVAFAKPQASSVKAAQQSIVVKFEWVRTRPKTSDMLAVRVDNGQICTATGVVPNSKGTRSVSVTPTMVDGDTVTLDLDIQSYGSATERLRTKVTVKLGETNIVTTAVTKQPDAKVEASEELLFVTAN